MDDKIQKKNDEIPEISLVCPDFFPFPFEPYPIQVDFMRNIFLAIEKGKIGIFESPTGTGKSLSIICGALTWLKKYKESMETSLQIIKEKEQLAQKSSESATDWLSADFEASKLKEALKAQRIKIENDVRRELQWKKRREKLAEKRRGRPGQNQDDQPSNITDCLRSIDNAIKDAKNGTSSDLPEAHLLPEDYDSDAEDTASSETPAEIDHVRKIYYCTRTHSQITQFIREIKKSPFGDCTRVSALASRQNLCLFEPVRQLKSQRLMNDRCIELQKGKTKAKPPPSVPGTVTGPKKRQKRDPAAETSCPYYKKENVENLSTHILNEVLDIEESGKAGNEAMACPYYASRHALSDAEVVAIPYNFLLHRATREASGICLKNQIVIIDEAHNLLDAIAGMYSAEITERQVKKALSQLEQYQTRYRTRLTPKNILYVKQLLFVLKTLADVWKPLPVDQQGTNPKSASQIYTMDKFLAFSKLESVNLFKILAYCRKSLLARKLTSFSELLQQEDSAGGGVVGLNQQTDAMGSPLMVIEAFLETLTNSNKDGRVVSSRDASFGGKLKFLLLNPAVYVSDIFQAARCVILAGGTMRPVSDFEDQLLSMAGVLPARIHKFACGHVVSPDNILPIALQSSPSGLKFEFNYENRTTEAMICQLGVLLINLCNIVPGGLVCFLPSYDYENSLFSVFSKSGDILKNIGRRKSIFREPKQAGDVEKILATFAGAVTRPMDGQTGAILFAVVGGKLSEGINFSDDLGRCVVMVGLPYPNMYSVELQEKMNFLNQKLPKTADGRLPGKVHYEGLCMKAVNQSIGRAIRHRDDYAVILLVDTRYASPIVNRGLPEWIGDRLQVTPKFGDAFGAIRRFFASKKTLDA